MVHRSRLSDDCVEPTAGLLCSQASAAHGNADDGSLCHLRQRGCELGLASVHSGTEVKKSKVEGVCDGPHKAAELHLVLAHPCNMLKAVRSGVGDIYGTIECSSEHLGTVHEGAVQQQSPPWHLMDFCPLGHGEHELMHMAFMQAAQFSHIIILPTADRVVESFEVYFTVSVAADGDLHFPSEGIHSRGSDDNGVSFDVDACPRSSQDTCPLRPACWLRGAFGREAGEGHRASCILPDPTEFLRQPVRKRARKFPKTGGSFFVYMCILSCLQLVLGKQLESEV